MTDKKKEKVVLCESANCNNIATILIGLKRHRSNMWNQVASCDKCAIPTVIKAKNP